MKLSIIIASYNSKEYIENCLSHIFNQGVDTEIIIVDDHSKDDSFEMLEKLRDEHKEIKLYVDDKKGTTCSRNYGLRQATGDIVTFCDQDDFFEKSSLKTVIDCFEKNDIDVLVSAFNFVVNGKKIYRGYDHKEFLTAKELFPHVINDQRVTGSCWSKFYRREALKDIFFEEDLWYAEDISFVSKALMKKQDAKCMIIDQAIYNYVDNPNNLTNNVDKRFDENNNLHYMNCFKRIRKTCNLDKSADEEIAYKIVWYALDTIRSLNPKGERRIILRKEIKDNIYGLYAKFFKYGFVNSLKKLLCIAYEFIFVRV